VTLNVAPCAAVAVQTATAPRIASWLARRGTQAMFGG
jgi:hypothetical protein